MALPPGHVSQRPNGRFWQECSTYLAGRNRCTAYSLRHTYICFGLMEGVDIYQIAKNYRTSVEMIEKFYVVHIKTALDTAAINVRRERPPPAKEQPRPPRRNGSRDQVEDEKRVYNCQARDDTLI